MTGLDKDIFRATRKLTTLLNEACNHWNYLCPYLEELGIVADRALEGYKRDYPKDVESLITEKSAPQRNCDMGTAEEQYKRFMGMCNSKDAKQCAECSMRSWHTLACSRDKCFARWSQMPYEKGAEK